MTGMRRIGSKLSGVLLAAVLLAGAHDAAFADGAAGPAVAPAEAARPDPADAVYDETQPGADDPRVKEGFAAYRAGEFKKAYDIWLPLAEAGNAEAQFRVGTLFDFGRGVAENLKAAQSWYRKSSDSKHDRAMFNLASLLYWGPSPFRDRQLGFELFLSGAEKGDALSQEQTGRAYAIGDGVRRDFTKAFMWLYLAKEAGIDTSIDAITSLRRFSDDSAEQKGIRMKREWLESHPRTNR